MDPWKYFQPYYKGKSIRIQNLETQLKISDDGTI